MSLGLRASIILAAVVGSLVGSGLTMMSRPQAPSFGGPGCQSHVIEIPAREGFAGASLLLASCPPVRP